MKYRSLDNKVFTAGSHRELAEALWKSQFDPPPTIEEWMAGSAKRARIWDESTLRTDTVEHHIEDMLAAGLMEVVP